MSEQTQKTDPALSDLRALLHGHKDGEIIVKNTSPQTTGGVHEVIDDVHKEHIAAKETEKLNINL